MGVSSPTIPLGTGVKVMTIVLQTNANFPAVTLLPIAGNSSVTQNKLTQFFNDLQRGIYSSNWQVIQGGVYAKGTATFASVVNTNTLVIGGVTITATNGTPTSVQFKVGGTDTITAANAVTTINALTTLNKVVQATSSGAVVTIASLVPGTIGNLITLSSTGGTITVGSALTGGTDGTKGVISHGL